MLEQALKLDPTLATAHESMGFLCAEQGKVDEANKWYSQAVALNSQSYWAHYYYAVNMLKRNLDEDSASKAEPSLRAAISINPSFAPAYDALGWLLALRPGNAEKPEKLHEAYMMALTAVELEPGNVHYRLNSAQILERMGRVDDAIKVAEHAASMAKTPEEQTAALALLAHAQQHRDYEQRRKEQEEAAAKAGAEIAASQAREASQRGQSAGPTPTPNEGDATSASANLPPRYVVVPAQHSPRPQLLPNARAVEGTIKDSKCSGASTLEITFTSPTGEMQLFSDNYLKIAYRAVNYNPEGILNPCVGMKGWHARITYHPAKSQQNQGEMVAVELVKE